MFRSRPSLTVLVLALALAALAVAFAAGAGGAAAVPEPRHGAPASGAEQAFVGDEIIVRERGGPERVVKLPPGIKPGSALAALERDPAIAYAARNWIATTAVDPLDRGTSGEVRGWRSEQWNFLGRPGGVRVLPAWRRVGDGGRGVTVAVVDTGVGYADGPAGTPFKASPGWGPGTSFANGYDFVDPGTLPLDENGHGTHIAGTIAEAVTLGTPVPEGESDYLTGLAYGAALMPVRVLDAAGNGTAAGVAAGIRWAARHGADVINISLQLRGKVKRCKQVPGICRALRQARQAGALVVAAAGNTSGGGRAGVAFPAAVRGVLAVGASTEGGCLAVYSDHGRRLDLLGPGGGRARPSAALRRCRGDGALIRQVTLVCFPQRCESFEDFAIRSSMGTSMAAAHASGVAALVRASGALGSDPRPRQLRKRLRCAARPLGRPRLHGAGLLDAARATRVTPPRRCRR